MISKFFENLSAVFGFIFSYKSEDQRVGLWIHVRNGLQLKEITRRIINGSLRNVDSLPINSVYLSLPVMISPSFFNFFKRSKMNQKEKKVVDYFLKALAVDDKIKTVCFSKFEVYDRKLFLESVCNLLKVNQNINELWLTDSLITKDEADIIADALSVNKGLKLLVLVNNWINNDVAKAISKGLRYNSTLRRIDFRSNLINDMGLEPIVEVLKANSTITEFDLTNNLINDDGINSLLKFTELNNFLFKFYHDPNPKLIIFESNLLGQGPIIIANKNLVNQAKEQIKTVLINNINNKNSDQNLSLEIVKIISNYSKFSADIVDYCDQAVLLDLLARNIKSTLEFNRINKFSYDALEDLGFEVRAIIIDSDYPRFSDINLDSIKLEKELLDANLEHRPS